MAAVDDHRPFVSREVQEQAARDILEVFEGQGMFEGLAWDEDLSEDDRRRLIVTVITTVKEQAVQAINEENGLDIPLDVIEE